MRRALICLRSQVAMLSNIQTSISSCSSSVSSSVRAQQRPLAFSTISRRQIACSAAGSRDVPNSALMQGCQQVFGVRSPGVAALGLSSLIGTRRTTHHAVRRHISTCCLGRDSTTTSAAAAAIAPPSASRAPNTSMLTFLSGAFELPHPDKIAKGGEDAHFVADCHTAVGVADGVGGWAEVGVDAGTYAKMLMRLAKDEADHGKVERNRLDPQELLEAAYRQTDVQGSATACIVCLHPKSNELLASNLGDSGFLLVRDGQIAFQSPPQQHDFNFPFQLGSVGSMSDPPEAAQHFRVAVQPGDTLVVGTDGLFDNVFAEEAAAIVYQCLLQQASADITAQVLVQYARMRAADRKYPSPFAQAAFQNGFSYMGGKMDDITVVVSYLTPVSEAAPLSKL